MVDNDTSPTIEQSLKMIEDKLRIQKEGISEKTYVLKENRAKDSSLSKLFKENKENKENKKKIIKPRKKDNVLLLTKKIDDNGKIVDLKKNKIFKKKIESKPKDSTKKEQDEVIDLSIKDHKNLNKTTNLAIIIKKLKKIRDEKLNNNNKKESSKKINKEILKLNETIDLAEDLFKKELLDL